MEIVITECAGPGWPDSPTRRPRLAALAGPPDPDFQFQWSVARHGHSLGLSRVWPGPGRVRPEAAVEIVIAECSAILLWPF